jgi:hypothetical protein
MKLLEFKIHNWVILCGLAVVLLGPDQDGQSGNTASSAPPNQYSLVDLQHLGQFRLRELDRQLLSSPFRLLGMSLLPQIHRFPPGRSFLDQCFETEV